MSPTSQAEAARVRHADSTATRRDAGGGGFSLVELLVVIGMIALMSALLVPAFNSISSGRRVEKNAWDVAGLLEQARTYAMSKHTYVWVGFQQSGENQIIGVVASRDGVENLSSGNLVRIHKGLNLERISLSGSLPAYGNRPLGTPAGVIQMSGAEATNSFTAEVAGVSRTFTKTVLEFNPRGEASVSPALDRWVEIGLQPTRGGAANTNNSAAIQLAGVSGTVRIFRP